MSFIGIDLGATFLKGAWLHPGSGLSDVHREPFPNFLAGLPPRRREVCIQSVLTAVHRLIKRLLDGQSCACAGILICGQMHGFVLVQPDGTPVGNFISWQDARCSETDANGVSHFEIAREKLGASLIAELGNEFRSGLPVATLHALARGGELAKGLMPLSLMDFIAASLTGAASFTHSTNAAAHGLFNVARGEWHIEALTALGLEDLRLPQPQSEIVPVGRARLCGRDFPVYIPVGDQQAALFGVSLVPGELSVNVATGSQVSVLVDKPEAGDWQLRPYFDGRWLRTITHLPAGRALNRMLHLCSELATDQGTELRDPWGQISRMAEAAELRSLKADLSFFPTAYGCEGAFTHILEDDITVGSFFRAAFRAMSENYAISAGRVSPVGWSCVVFSGGLVQRLPVLRAEILDRLGASSRSVIQVEDTLEGLLALSCRVVASK